MRKFKTILLFLIMSLMSIMCFSEEIYYKNKVDNRYSLLIVYNDVKLVADNRYKQIRILDKNDNEIFIFSNENGNIIKTNEYVIISDNMCILYFYEISFENIRDWYYYPNGGSIQKQYLCKKVIVEIKNGHLR